MVDANLSQRVQQQRNAFKINSNPTLAQRQQALKNLEEALLNHQNALIQALQSDFGQRAVQEIQLAEVVPSISALRHARKNVKKWIKPHKRSVNVWFSPARSQVYYQPLGVVGIIAPWQAPLSRTIEPLAAALAAGNRVIIKLSELAPHSATVIQKIIHSAFHDNEVYVVASEVETVAFAASKFDHLFYSGTDEMAKQVMQMASAHLTPVTFVLGGKSPVIIGEDADWNAAVERIIMSKLRNAGQTSIAPDYVFVPNGKQTAFVDVARQIVQSRYPAFKDNADYVSTINDAQYQRLQNLRDQAEQQGAEVVCLIPPEQLPLAKSRRFPPTLIVNPKFDQAVCQTEIFGPLLPILPYDDLEDVVAYINNHPQPLAAYYFGRDNKHINYVIDNLVCGGMTINDTMLHAWQNDLPFGGVGSSGMGRYHGFDGFVTFSNPKAVLQQKRSTRFKWLYPPYGVYAKSMIKLLLNR